MSDVRISITLPSRNIASISLDDTRDAKFIIDAMRTAASEYGLPAPKVFERVEVEVKL